MSIAEFSIKRPITTVMFFVSLCVVGLIAAVRLPLEAFPAVTFPGIAVELPYSGSTPEEVERSVLRPAEEAVSTLSGIKRMESRARADGASMFIMFKDWSRDAAIAASEARERIDAIRDQLPNDLQRYFVLKFSTSDQPVLKVRLASNRDMTREYDLIDREFKRRIERISGVAKVDVLGAPANEVEIAVSPDRLTAHGISLDQLGSRLREMNFSLSGGQIDDGGRRVRVQPVGEITDLQQYRDMIIDGRNTRLSDVADVVLKPARINYGRRLDGQPAVGLDIYKERGANLVEVSRRVLQEVNTIATEPTLKGVQVLVVEDQGESVTSSLTELAEAGLVGLLLSIAVLYFFLRHWPSTLMVTTAIPICFVMTLGFMYFAGVTLNILTMMGLLLAVGMLVDNAVVVVESIYQERERMPDRPMLASLIGTRNVAIALSAGTLCHCIVFLPNLFGDRNQISIFMAQIAITISVSLLASWLVAVSLIPMLSARLKTPPAVRDDDGLIARLQRRYAGFLRWTLQHRGWSVTGIVLIIAASCVATKFAMMNINMFGGDDKEKIAIYYQWNGAYTRQQLADEIVKTERFLEAHREDYHILQIYSVYSEDGAGSTQLKVDSSKVGDIKQLTERLRKEMPKSARAKIGIGDDNGPGGGSGNSLGENIQVQLVGDSTETLQKIAGTVVPMLARNAELRDVRVDVGDTNSELSVQVDRERAASFGFSTQQVSQFVALALRGTPLREFRRGDNEVPVWVRFAGAEHYGVEDLSGFTVRAPDGRMVPLLAMVNVRQTAAATEINRSNRQTALTIKANLAPGIAMPAARKAMEGTMESARKNGVFDDGYAYTFDGSGFQNDDEAFVQMLVNLALALVMIYGLMAAVFDSLLFPAAIMSCVLFSIFGVFWLFLITGTEFNIMAFIGILVLMGVVVNNGIVMIEHINNLRRRGMSRTDALVEGSRERLRPIMMTMGTAILAMVPIAMGTTKLAGEGPPYFPMARAIAGGLAFSTVVSLLFLPTIYAMLDDLREASARILRRAQARKGDAATPPALPIE